MIQRHTVSHLKALIVDNDFLGGQGRDIIMGLPRLLFLKSSIYHKECAWQASENATPPIFRIEDAYNQGFQMRRCFLFLPFLVLSKFNEMQNQHFRCVIAIDRHCISVKKNQKVDSSNQCNSSHSQDQKTTGSLNKFSQFSMI